jgi:hypothetical protein
MRNFKEKQILKKSTTIILLLILALFLSCCATKRKAREYNSLHGLMLLENRELKINKQYYHQKYYNPKKNKSQKYLKKNKK